MGRAVFHGPPADRHFFSRDAVGMCVVLWQMLSGGNKVYSEVEGMQLLLQYRVRHERSVTWVVVVGNPERGSCVRVDDRFFFVVACVSGGYRRRARSDGVEAGGGGGGGGIRMTSSYVGVLCSSSAFRPVL